MTLRIITGDYIGIKKEVIQKHQYFDTSFHFEVNMDLLIRLLKTEPQIIIDKPGALESEDYQFELGQELCHVVHDLTIFTYSSLLIQGIRYGVQQKFISHKNVEIVFYKSDGECVGLSMSEYGVIDSWPKGFMDTDFKASKLLLKGGLKVLRQLN
jgi:predicted ATPase